MAKPITKSAGWKGSVVMASSKLSFKEPDWKLAGHTVSTVLTRTRHGGQGRPNLENKRLYLEPSSPEKSPVEPDSEIEEDAESEEEIEETKAGVVQNPPATMVLLEVDALKETMEKHCKCPKCHGPMDMSFQTVCLATRIGLWCHNSTCGYVCTTEPASGAAALGCKDNGNMGRTTDYAVNVLYALSFLSMGDGCTEAACPLGLLGLPSNAAMECRSFTFLEEHIGPTIQKLAQEVLLENLIEQVRVSTNNFPKEDFELWKQSMCDDSIVLDESKHARIRAYLDMALQQRKKTSDRYYSCKSKYAASYKVLLQRLDRFVTVDRLKEIAHSMDAQVNESVDNTASWFAPRKKSSFGSRSLSNRLGMAVGINSLGVCGYFSRLFELLCIKMTPNVLHYLQQKEKHRNDGPGKIKTKDQKVDRIKRKVNHAIAKKEHNKKEGSYKSGVTLDEEGVEGYTAEDLQQPKKQKTDNESVICPKSHSEEGPAAAPAEATITVPSNDAAADVDAMPIQYSEDKEVGRVIGVV